MTTYQISGGVATPIVQVILGNASSRMTQELYTQFVPAHQTEELPVLAEPLPRLASSAAS